MMKLRIGASEGASPLGLNEFQSPGRFFAEKLGLIEREDNENEATFLGRHMEHSIADAFAERHDVRLHRWGSVLSMRDPWLGATPDRVIFPEDMSHSFRQRFDVDDDEVVLVEIKSTGLASYQPPRKIEMVWGAPLTDNVPGRYVVQTQLQASVLNEHVGDMGFVIRRVIVAALLPGRGLVDYVVRTDRPIGKQIVDQLRAFVVNHLQTGRPPPPETEDDWRLLGDISRQQMTDKKRIKVVDGSPAHALMMQYRAITTSIEVAELAKMQARAQMIDIIGTDYALDHDTLGSITLSSPKEVSTPKLAKPRFADEVLDAVAEFEALDPTNPLIERLKKLRDECTKTHTAGRVLSPHWKKLPLN